MERKINQFEAEKASVVAVWVTPPGRSATVVRKLGLTYPVLSDVDLATIRAYGVEDAQNGIAWPAIYIVGTDGKIRWRSLVEDYKVRPAADVVLAALRAR